MVMRGCFGPERDDLDDFCHFVAYEGYPHMVSNLLGTLVSLLFQREQRLHGAPFIGVRPRQHLVALRESVIL
jgi:hypothetical protein